MRWLNREDGRLSYTLEGSGPLVVAVPGMGDLRATYREIVPALVAVGHRVAVLDLRGHGDSDVDFAELGDAATGSDVLALIDELGGPAVVLGSSMGAAAACWAASERPDAVAGLVHFGPVLRDAPAGSGARWAMRALLAVLLGWPWGPAFWASYYRSALNRGRRAPWLDAHAAAIRASLREPGRLRSFRRLALTLSHAEVEGRAGGVRAPSLAFVGDLDPDYPDPAAERAWLAGLGIDVVAVPEAAHYPHAQRPDLVLPRVLTFVAAVVEGDPRLRPGVR